MLQDNNIIYEKGGMQKEVYTDKSELESWPCPLCGSEDEKYIKTERGLLKIVKCSKCSLLRVNPRLKEPDSIYHGEREKYEKEFKLIISGQKPHHRDKNYRADLDIIKRYKPTGEFLDVGTNVGSFLRLARGQGWNLTGIEPSKVLANLARDSFGLNIINSFLEDADLKAESFDVVTMIDVFEHVVNPKDILKEVKRVLKKDGILLVKVPNGKYNEMKHFVRKKLGKTNTDDFDSYEHVCHYSAETLREMLEISGYKVDKIMIDLPVQLPSWHKHVGEFFQYESPFYLDWKAHLGRSLCYYLSILEQFITKRIGYFAPNITCVARPK